MQYIAHYDCFRQKPGNKNKKVMEPKAYLEMFFASRQPTAENRRYLLEDFCNKEKYLDAARQILSLQDMLMKDYIRKNRVEDIRRQPVLVPNGTVGQSL